MTSVSARILTHTQVKYTHITTLHLSHRPVKMKYVQNCSECSIFFQTKQKFLYTVPVKSLDTPSHFLRRFFFDFIIFYMVDTTFFV